MVNKKIQQTYPSSIFDCKLFVIDFGIFFCDLRDLVMIIYKSGPASGDWRLTSLNL